MEITGITGITGMLEVDTGDREILEKAEARTLVCSFLYSGKSADWLKNAMRVTARIYGNGSEDRIKAYMRIIWTKELCL